MHCPRDATELITGKYEADIEVDLCGTCHGIWLDKGELEAIQRSSERDYTRELATGGPALAGTRPEVSAPSGPALCPRCGTEMAEGEYAFCSQVMVDVCPEGCGVWLDAGELQELEKFFEREQQVTMGERASLLLASLLSVFHRPQRRRVKG